MTWSPKVASGFWQRAETSPGYHRASIIRYSLGRRHAGKGTRFKGGLGTLFRHVRETIFRDALVAASGSWLYAVSDIVHSSTGPLELRRSIGTQRFVILARSVITSHKCLVRRRRVNSGVLPKVLLYLERRAGGRNTGMPGGTGRGEGEGTELPRLLMSVASRASHSDEWEARESVARPESQRHPPNTALVQNVTT